MQPGSLVICVNAKGLENKTVFSAPLIEGELYIVRELIEDTKGPAPQFEPGIAVEEIQGKIVLANTWRGLQHVECHFHIWRFREVLPPGVLEEALHESEYNFV